MLNLVKDQKIDITKTNPGLASILVGAGWDVSSDTSKKYDLDLFAVCLVNGNAIDKIVFYNNRAIPGINLSEDNRTGIGDGDDETMQVIFSALDPNVDGIVIGINIYDATSRGQSFSMIKNSYITISDGGASVGDTITPLAKLELNEDFGNATGVIMGKLYKRDGEWKFEAIGVPVTGNIAEIVANY